MIRKLHQDRTINEQWALLVSKSTTPLDLHHLGRFTKLLPPPDRYWSDPFLVKHANRHYIFIEERLYQQGRGRIACMQVTEQGHYSPPITVLERPYSLSYPFIFRYLDQYYLIPESAESGQVELYRCTRFPDQWVLEHVVMQDVSAFDTTMFEHQGRWWLMQSRITHPHSNPSASLYLFYAASPLSREWIAHPHNPIVTEADRARPAGRLFHWEGKLYRPSQNCAGTEGRGINLNEITTLNPQHYQEHAVVRCIPEGRHQLGGIRTLAFNNDITVLDGLHLHART